MWLFKRKDKKITTAIIAPDFALKDVNGNVVRLSEYRGQKNVVLVFLRSFL